MNDIQQTSLSVSNGKDNNKIPAVSDGRTQKDVELAVITAKRFPRDIEVSINNILKATRRKRLAEAALYSFPRGKEKIEGPSIRLAEAIAQSWGNISFGVREIESNSEKTSLEAYCIDRESNVSKSMYFEVRHERKTQKWVKKITDPRDIYEHVHNYGARRLRNCILSVVPSYVVEEAIDSVKEFLSREEVNPERIKKMVNAFRTLQIEPDMISKRLGHTINTITNDELISLVNVYNTIKDGVAPAKDFFQIPSDSNFLENIEGETK